MYKIVVMSEDHIELTDDQIKLVEAFEAAANYFAARIMNEADLAPDLEDVTVEKLVDLFGLEQANSKIAEEALRQFSDIMEECSEYPEYYYPVVLGWIKIGGMSDDKNYFLVDAIGTYAPTKRAKIQEDCRQAVMRALLWSPAANPLPDDYRGQLLKQNGSIMPGL